MLLILNWSILAIAVQPNFLFNWYEFISYITSSLMCRNTFYEVHLQGYMNTNKSVFTIITAAKRSPQVGNVILSMIIKF